MDLPKYSKTDPAVMLLNEIEILLAQTRLMELYLRQAQATAANETASIHEQYQAELGALRSAFAEKERRLQTQTISRDLHENLQTELARLQDQLREKQAYSQTISTQLEQAKHNAAALSRQITELQASSYESQAIAAQKLEQARTRFESEVISLQTALASRDQSLRDNENAFAEAEHSLKTEIIALRSQLEQRQELIEFRDDELRDAHGQLAALQQRVVELESSNDSMAANTEQIDLLRSSFENQIAALQHQVAVKEQALSQRQEAITAVELALHGKIQELQEELARSRNVRAQLENELQRTGAEAALLRRQLGELGTVAANADQTTQQLVEEKKHSRELDAELTRLHAILAQTEYAVKERENLARSVEERLGGEINQLRNELEKRQNDTQSTGAEIIRLQSELAALREQNSRAEIARQKLEQAAQDAASQRQELANHLRAKEDELRAAQANALELQAAALKEQESRFGSAKEQLSAEINSLRGQLAERQAHSEQGLAEAGRLHAEIADLQTRYSQLQLSHREIEENWHRAVASQQDLAASLEQKEQGLAIASELKAQFDAAAAELQLKLTEKSLLAESRGAELANLKTDVQRLSAQLAQRESVASQATADFHRELESIRATHQAEVSALQEQHRAKREDFEKEVAREKQSAAELHAQIKAIELRAGEVETNLKNRDEVLRAAKTEAETLQARLRELESMGEKERAAAGNEAEQARVRFEAELAALRNDLQQKAWALAQQQATAENLALTHRSQIQNLEAKLAEQQSTLQDRNRGVEKAQAEVHSLQQRSEELKAELERVRSSGSAQAEQITLGSASQIDHLSKQLAQQTAEIEERASSQAALEQSLRSEINRLIQENQEKNQILQDRNDEVLRVKAEMDLLSDKLGQLESSASQAEANLTGESEQMRTELQAELALLQAELSQKEWALEERDATARGLQQKYLDEIASLRQQLAEKENALSRAEREFVLGEPQLQPGQGNGFQMEDGKALDGHANSTAHERRWHTGFGWKRRWKSEES